MSQIKFEKAKEKLNNSLGELEDLILSKIPSSDLNKRIEDLEEELEKLREENKIKDETINSLNAEVNDLQKNMAEIGKETEFLNEKNKHLSDDFQRQEEERRILLNEIIDYVNQIEELVKNEN